MPAASQLDWLSSTTAIIALFWSRATRDLLRSFGWGIAALHRLHAATKLPFPRRPPHRISWSHLWMRVSSGERSEITELANDGAGSDNGRRSDPSGTSRRRAPLLKSVGA